MQETPVLGKLVTGSPGRDAVHIAIAPVVAAWRINPGEHVGLREDGRAQAMPAAKCIGIVDPFLDAPVLEGQTFYLCLYPGSITGLRHVWTSPSFVPRVPGKDVAGD